MSKLLALVSTVAAVAVLGTSGVAFAGGRDHRDGATTSAVTAAHSAKQGLAAYNDQYRNVNAKSKKSKSKKKH